MKTLIWASLTIFNLTAITTTLISPKIAHGQSNCIEIGQWIAPNNLITHQIYSCSNTKNGQIVTVQGFVKDLVFSDSYSYGIEVNCAQQTYRWLSSLRINGQKPIPTLVIRRFC